MLQLINNTPFESMLIPSLDKHGHTFIAAVVKGKFEISMQALKLIIAQEQQPLHLQDIYWGEAGTSSVKYEADIAPIKNGTDIVLNGYAYSPFGRPSAIVDASLQVGHYKKIVRVFGDRVWHKNALRWLPTPPHNFERMHLVYENAFGGELQTKNDQSCPEFCVQNPLGKGFVGRNGRGLYEGLALPNLEQPTNLIRFWDDAPSPAGFGFIGRSWAPRKSYAGTYDEPWQQLRMPLQPLDFDERYYNGAHPDWVLKERLLGGEEVVATNLSESGLLRFWLPNYQFMATVIIKGKRAAFMAAMDTIVIEPDDLHVLITWRAIIPCARQFLYIDKVTLDWRAM